MSSNISSNIFIDRATSGVYDTIAELIMDMGNASLSAAEYGLDFHRSTDVTSRNYVYRDNSNAEFRTNIVGQICSPSLGTIISAKGNHYAGRPGEFKPITDDSKVKDVLVIGLPSCATALMSYVYYNQVASLNDVRVSDEKEEMLADIRPIIKEWIRTSSSDPQIAKDLITLHMLPKYGPPPQGGDDMCKRVIKRTLSQVNDDIVKNVELSQNPQIKLGAFYNPALNADYGGPYFQHSVNKLVQLDIRGLDNELIPPWELYKALRPGTLILANCSLHCFIMKNGDMDRKIYQINMHSARILCESDIAVEEPIPPTVPGSVIERKATTTSVSSATLAFSNFNTARILPLKTTASAVTKKASGSASGSGAASGSSLVVEGSSKKAKKANPVKPAAKGKSVNTVPNNKGKSVDLGIATESAVGDKSMEVDVPLE